DHGADYICERGLARFFQRSVRQLDAKSIGHRHQSHNVRYSQGSDGHRKNSIKASRLQLNRSIAQ
uniref:Uncharacterized protein n=1 Tax=Globisporangium ultimum (strain ATCC 200006 / CBS 805.95 / DAOM BR144) TaxID=431595 RepID=K3X582_GLOUD